MPATTLFTQAFAPYLALGIGELGCAAAALGRQEGLADALPWAACDVAPARLIATGLRRKLLVEDPPRVSAEAARAYWASREDELRALAARRTVAVLFGHLSDPSAAWLAPGLARTLGGLGLRVCMIGMTDEGGGAWNDSCGLVDSAELVVLVSGGLPFPHVRSSSREAFAGARLLLQAVHAQLGACAGGVSFDELKAALRGSGPIHAVVGSGEGRDSPLEALEASLRGVQACGSIPSEACMALALTSGRETTLAEYRQLRERLAAAAPPGASALLGVGCDGVLGDESHALVLWRQRHSSNVLRFA